MELKDLGFDHWFQDKQEDFQRPDCNVARVIEVNRDSYIVKSENCEVPAEITGSLMFSVESTMNLPAVGDWVLAQYHNDNTFAVIHALFPRKSFLRRKVSGRKIDYQMIASNIDVALIVQSCDFDFNVRRLERYLVMVNEGGIEPVLLLTKSDLISPEIMEQRISEVRQSNIHCKIITLSNKTGFGQDHVHQFLAAGKTYCLLGSSGVGKTTLLNHLLGHDLFETKTVREHDGRGRHATTRRQLIVLPQGAMLIDTPGMRELGNIGANNGIDGSFSDILTLTRSCRFSNCTHTSESGCSLLAAIENGELSEERYRNYLKLLNESEYYNMSYVEKRKKDRKFGQFIKSAKKQIRKN
ncbi:MAG: ribosome small subunit-dependent GTPase A [Candidatus Ozemobacteraceae bacterium]